MQIVINNRPIGYKQKWKPRTKKRRIQNKWNKRAKKPLNFTPIFLNQPMIWGDKLICTSQQAESIRMMATHQNP